MIMLNVLAAWLALGTISGLVFGAAARLGAPGKD